MFVNRLRTGSRGITFITRRASTARVLGEGEGGETTPAPVRTAQHAWERSCYFNIDYYISESSTVYEAIQRMAAYNVGCLMVGDKESFSGMLTERDYVCKIALLGRCSKDTLVKDICTNGQKVVSVKRSDSIDTCVEKMLSGDVRHLPVIDDETNKVIGLISVKDLIKEFTKEKDELISKLFSL